MPVTVPADLADIFEDPEIAFAALRELKAIREARLKLVASDGNTSAVNATALFKPDAGGLTLLLPLQFKTAIADSTATAASVSTTLNTLLAQLRANGQLPS